MAPLKKMSLTIVTVKTPWYGFNFLLSFFFRRAQSEYSALPGLLFKAYTIFLTGKGKFYGGIYLWENEENALKWFSPRWREEIIRKRGFEPVVEYFSVDELHSFVPEELEYDLFGGKAVAVRIDQVPLIEVKKFTKDQPGLLRIYVYSQDAISHGIILFFSTEEKANTFIAENSLNEFRRYLVPVMQENRLS